MTRIVGLAALSLAVAGFAVAAASARTTSYALPQESVPAELSTPDTEVIVANCAACHSLDYITTQPRGKGPQFWRDEVTKMVNVYKAPIAPADADSVAKALAATFG